MSMKSESNNRGFTEKQDQTLLKMHGQYSNEIIGERLGKRRATIERRYRELTQEKAQAGQK